MTSSIRATHDDPAGADRDRGAVLAMTLVLTTVLSIVVVALLTYTQTGLRTSQVTTARTDTNSAATAALYFAVEHLATGSGACDSSIAIPLEAMPERRPVEVRCDVTTSGDPATYRLTASPLDSNIGSITASIEVRASEPAPRGVRIVDWASTN